MIRNHARGALAALAAVALAAPGVTATAAPSTTVTAGAPAAAPRPALRLARELGGQEPATGRASASAAAAGDTGDVARIRQALQDLLTGYPEVRTAMAAREASGYARDAAGFERYPRFQLGTSLGDYAGSSSNVGSYDAVIASVRVNLLDGGAISARIRGADADVQAQDAALRATRQKVLLDAMTAYLEVQRLQMQARIARGSADVLAQLARAERRRVELGATGQTDLRLALSRTAGFGARQQEYAAKGASAEARFQTYFGFAPPPAGLPALQAPAMWTQGGSEAAVDAARNVSAELEQARKNVEVARASVDEAKAGWFPAVDAVVSHAYDPDQALYNKGTRYGIELNWKLGTGFEIDRQIRSALAEVRNQEASLDSVRLNLDEQTRGAWSAMTASRERERQLAIAAQEGRAAFEGKRRLLDAGRETLLNVLNAQVDYYNQLLDYADALFDRRIAEFRLARATGRLAADPGTTPDWFASLFTNATAALPDVDGFMRGSAGAADVVPSTVAVAPAAGFAAATSELSGGPGPLASDARTPLRLDTGTKMR